MAKHPTATKPPEDPNTDQHPPEDTLLQGADQAALNQPATKEPEEEEEMVIRCSIPDTKDNKMNRKIAKLVEAHARALGETQGATVVAIGPTSVVYHGDKIGARKVSTE